MGSGLSLRKLGEGRTSFRIGVSLSVAPKGAGTDLEEFGVEWFRGEQIFVPNPGVGVVTKYFWCPRNLGVDLLPPPFSFTNHLQTGAGKAWRL